MTLNSKIFFSTLTTIFFPLKNLQYFQQFFIIITNIYVLQNPFVKAKIKILKFFLLCEAINLIYLSNPNLSDYQRFVNF